MMVKKVFCLLLVICMTVPFLAKADPNGHYNWYEVFVRSYQDSGGDGVGDLKGLTDRLDYISDLGFNGLWLMPIMPSPSYHKYDVTDYFQVDPEYGTLEDVKILVQEAHQRGISVIFDLPVNHTSVLHPWFVAAAEALREGKTSSYTDYYHFQKNDASGFVPLAGTDWFYEEQFARGGMPDLNLGSEAVRAEIREILNFWLQDIGADGFRLDAVTSFYTGDHEKNITFLRWLKETCEEIKPGSFLVGECWTGLSTISQYYDSGVDSFFLFPASQAEGFVISSLRGRSSHAEKFAKAYQNVLEQIPNGTLAPFLCNHDTGRTIGSVQGRNNLPIAKFAEGLLSMMNGCAFLSYGEEIGMVGSGDDPNKRLAMYWSDEPGAMTMQPPGVTNLEYAYPSLVTQQEDASSLWSYIRQAFRIRQALPVIADGKNTFVHVDGDVCLMKRENDSGSVLIAINFSSSKENLCPITGSVSILYDQEAGEKNSSLDSEGLHMPPYSIVVLKETTQN